MSLQVWLPLNGSTINQGIGGRKMNGAPKSWGNSLYATFSGSTNNVIYNNSSDWNYTDQFSFSCFINPNYTGSAAQYVFTVGRADSGGYGYGLQIISAASVRVWFGSQSLTVDSVPSNTWTHIALTVNGTSALVYRNGDLVGSIAVSDASKPTYSDGNGLGIGCFHYSGNIYPYYGSIRDFRIYDNVLSPKEIREISNGILVHLPLTNPLGRGRKNYFKNHTGITSANSSTISTYDSSFNGFTVGSAVTTSTWGSGFNIPNNSMVVPYGSSYTVSMDVYLPSKHSITIDFNNGVSSGSAWAGNDNDNNGKRWTKNISNIPANTWTHISFGSTNSHASNTSHIGIKPGDWVGLITSGDSAAVSWKVKNIKVELGSTESGYSDAADDIGINSYLGNTSGITPKGTITGTLLNDSESPRGTGSLKCELDIASGNGSNFIQVVTGLGSLGQFTVTGWVKPHSCGGYSTIVSNSRSLGSSGLWIAVNTESHGLWAYRNKYLTYTSDPLLTIDTWYHFAFTFNAGKVQMFVNGTAVSSVTDWSSQGTTVDLSNLYIFNSYTGTGWDTHFVGNLSDIRVYSTVLSQTEITNLYNAPIQIANSGALMTQGEIVESCNIALTRGGVISSPDVSQLVTPSVLSDGSLWKLIFYHDCRNGTVLFSSAAEAQHCDEPYKYSILDEMDKFRRSDGAYEFLLYYPEISTTKYNRWSQTINPTAEFLADGGDYTKKVVEGYTAIHVDYTDVHWGGLERQNSDATSTSACYLNGSCNHNTWHYAIGSYEKWFDGMPGPDTTIEVNKVFLYQRADTGTTRIYNNRIASEDLNEY